MPKYLMQVSLTKDGAKGVAKDGAPSDGKQQSNSLNRPVANWRRCILPSVTPTCLR